jgi:hypothetical protein
VKRHLIFVFLFLVCMTKLCLVMTVAEASACQLQHWMIWSVEGRSQWDGVGQQGLYVLLRQFPTEVAYDVFSSCPHTGSQKASSTASWRSHDHGFLVDTRMDVLLQLADKCRCEALTRSVATGLNAAIRRNASNGEFLLVETGLQVRAFRRNRHDNAFFESVLHDPETFAIVRRKSHILDVQVRDVRESAMDDPTSPATPIELVSFPDKL